MLELLAILLPAVVCGDNGAIAPYFPHFSEYLALIVSLVYVLCVFFVLGVLTGAKWLCPRSRRSPRVDLDLEQGYPELPRLPARPRPPPPVPPPPSTPVLVLRVGSFPYYEHRYQPPPPIPPPPPAPPVAPAPAEPEAAQGPNVGQRKPKKKRRGRKPAPHSANQIHRAQAKQRTQDKLMRKVDPQHINMDDACAHFGYEYTPADISSLRLYLRKLPEADQRAFLSARLIVNQAKIARLEAAG